MEDTLALKYSNSIGVITQQELAKRDQTGKSKEGTLNHDKLKQTKNPARKDQVYQTHIYNMWTTPDAKNPLAEVIWNSVCVCVCDSFFVIFHLLNYSWTCKVIGKSKMQWCLVLETIRRKVSKN